MTNIEKEKIRYLRCEGLGYKAIASRLSISENTVKSFCKRNGLSGVAGKGQDSVCRHCGKSLDKKPGYENKKFCSGACRSAWWNNHPYLINRESVSRRACAHCGKLFESYKSKNRKYCGHACYIKARFGEEGGYDTGAI